MLPTRFETPLRRELGYNHAQISQVVMDFFHNSGDLAPYGPLSNDMEAYAWGHILAEQRKRLRVDYSIVIEHPEPEKFRAIIFETDYKGATSVRDIGIRDTLSALKKWFMKSYKDEVRAVHVNGGLVMVSDPWLTATCLIQKSYTELDMK